MLVLAGSFSKLAISASDNMIDFVWTNVSEMKTRTTGQASTVYKPLLELLVVLIAYQWEI